MEYLYIDFTTNGNEIVERLRKINKSLAGGLKCEYGGDCWYRVYSQFHNIKQLLANEGLSGEDLFYPKEFFTLFPELPGARWFNITRGVKRKHNAAGTTPAAPVKPSTVSASNIYINLTSAVGGTM